MSDALLPTEAALLRRLAGLMIPASAQYGVPGADDPLIQSDILKTLGRDIGHVRAALALFGQDGGSVEDATAAQQAADRTLASDRPEIATLGRVILASYYRDDRVLRSVGMDERAPYPG